MRDGGQRKPAFCHDYYHSLHPPALQSAVAVDPGQVSPLSLEAVLHSLDHAWCGTTAGLEFICRALTARAVPHGVHGDIVVETKVQDSRQPHLYTPYRGAARSSSWRRHAQPRWISSKP